MRPLHSIKHALHSCIALIAGCYWHTVGEKIRARNRFCLVFGAKSVRKINNRVANQVCESQARLTEPEVGEIRNEISRWPDKPLISIVMPVYNTVKAELIEAIASVRSQYYENWELCIADDCSTKPYIREILESAIADDARIKVVFRETNGHVSESSNSAIEIATGMFVALMDHDDILPRHALYHVAKEILNYPEVDLIYSDEDKIRANGSLAGPHFKPDWNEELFLTQNYINHLGVYRTSLIREIGGFRINFEGSQDHDLVLRFLERTDESRIRHIPKILYHWRAHHGSGTFSDRALHQAIDARQRAVRDYLKSRYPKIEASVVRGPFGCNRIVRELPAPAPHVTIIIPIRDRIDLLEKCVTSLFDKTIYPSFDVIIVDNDSEKTETFTYLDDLSRKYPVNILKYNGSFNYSAINNRAVEKASGDVVVLLNNDIEVISSEWLREMVSYAIQPNIGAVGAKLLYDNGTVQHAGIILGTGGIANHAFHGYAARDTGYHARLQLPQYISAVTGACLAVEKKKYQLVGGLDETDLQVAYNDVDLCLKLASNGFYNIYTPYACLLHYQSASRGTDTTPEKSERLKRESEVMRKRWGGVLENDKYYNPNFSSIDSRFRFLAE